MDNLGDFPDKQYPYLGFDYLRLTARALILDEQNNILFNVVDRNDQFGKLTYLELPGGGIKEGEEIESALKREIREELGLLIEIIAPIGMVSSSYNLLKQENKNYYYLCKAIGTCPKKISSKGDSLIKETISLDIVTAIDRLNKQIKEGYLNEVVATRELPILLKAKEILFC